MLPQVQKVYAAWKVLPAVLIPDGCTKKGTGFFNTSSLIFSYLQKEVQILVHSCGKLGGRERQGIQIMSDSRRFGIAQPLYATRCLGYAACFQKFHKMPLNLLQC